MSKMIPKARAFCGLGIFNEDDIAGLKGIEAICESCPQFLESTLFYFRCKKYDLVGNMVVGNGFIPENSIILSSMIMSMGSIVIAINGWMINKAKLRHGKDYYKDIFSTSLCSISFIVYCDVMLAGLLLSFFIGFVVML